MLGQRTLGSSGARGDLGHDIVNSRLVIQRQGGWLSSPWGGGSRGWGLPPALSAPDGKLSGIGHMSKAMTGVGKGQGGQGVSLCLHPEKARPWDAGQGAQEAAARTRTLKPAEPQAHENYRKWGSKVPEVYFCLLADSQCLTGAPGLT